MFDVLLCGFVWIVVVVESYSLGSLKSKSLQDGLSSVFLISGGLLWLFGFEFSGVLFLLVGYESLTSCKTTSEANSARSKRVVKQARMNGFLG